MRILQKTVVVAVETVGSDSVINGKFGIDQGRGLPLKYSPAPTLSNQTGLLSLRGSSAHPELVEGRGNLVEVEHTSANHHCYGDEIANLPH